MIVKNLYLTKNEPIFFEVAQGAAGVQFGIRVQDYTIPEGAVVNIYVSKPDGTLVYNAAEVSGNTITVTTTTQMTAVVGRSNCQVQVTSTGILLRTFVFALQVKPSIIDETAIESTDEFGALETALQTVSQYDAEIEALQDDVEDIDTRLQNKGSANVPVYFDATGTPQIAPNLIAGDWTTRTAIPSGSNLDNYKTPGCYSVTTDAIAGTISNIPRTASGQLIVIQNAGALYQTQVYIPSTVTPLIYIRSLSNGSWGGWVLSANLRTYSGAKTTSAGGNFSQTFSNSVVVLAAYSNLADTLVIPYPVSGTGTGGATEWWFHVQSVSGSAVVSTNITATIFYMMI